MHVRLICMLSLCTMRPLPPRTISPHMPKLAAMVTHHLPSLTRTLGLQILCLTLTYALALAYVTRLRSTRCWCGTLELILVPLTHTRGVEEQTVSSPVLPLIGTALSQNLGIPVSGGNPSLYVRATGNGSTPSAHPD